MAKNKDSTFAKQDVRDIASATRTEFLDEMEGHLERADAMLDGLYTLANTGDIGSLKRGSLGLNIDAIMRQVAEMRLALDTHRMELAYT